jgi:hypothetical protein
MIMRLFCFIADTKKCAVSRVLLVCLFLASILFSNCKSKKTYKTFYFDDNKTLKAEGYYIDGKTVDTFKSFSKNGKIDYIKVYDANGILQGESRFYNQDGSLAQKVNYKEGEKDSVFTSFWSNGKAKIKGFFYKDKPMGDALSFDSLGRLRRYSFSDFNNQALMVCQYDTSGEVSGNDDHDYYFIDSTTTSNGTGGVDTVKTLILISHQPKTLVKLRVDNIGQGGRIVKTSDIDINWQIVSFNNLVTKDVDTIKLVGVRYDSVLQRNKTFIIVRADFRANR